MLVIFYILELHDTNHSPGTSIIVDDEATPQPMTVPATPERQVQGTSAYFHRASRVVGQKL